MTDNNMKIFISYIFNIFNMNKYFQPISLSILGKINFI